MTREEDLNSWVGWLHARIPELKGGANEFWIRQALEGYAKEYTKPKTKTFKMCFHPSNVGKAIESAKMVIEHPLFRNDKESFFQISAIKYFDRRFTDHVWFEITYSREFLVYLFGNLMNK